MPFSLTAYRIRQLVNRFVRADNGNTAMIFALSFIPLLIFIGSAVDYSRFNAARTAMQSAVDSTALMVSKDLASGKITKSQVDAAAQTYFQGLYVYPEAKNVSVNAVYAQSNGKLGSNIDIRGSGEIATDFMYLFGFSTLSFGASSSTAWSSTRLRVALVLDNTASMSESGKMTALKGGAKSLVDQLTANVTPGSDDVLISLVPFTISVNVKYSGSAGSVNENASWLIGWTSTPAHNGAYMNGWGISAGAATVSNSFQAWEDPPNLFTNGTVSPTIFSSLKAGSACPFSYITTTDGNTFSATSYNWIRPNYVIYPFSCNQTSENTIYNVTKTIGAGGLLCPGMDVMNWLYYNGCYQTGIGSGLTWIPNAHSTWNGCVSDREQPYDTKNDPPNGSAAAFPVYQAYGCPTPLKPLSDDWTGIKAQIDAMVPLGNTNQAIGLAWGWMMLTPNNPFGSGSPLNAPAEIDSTATYRQAVILLSDGLNTQNRWTLLGGNASQVDARQQILCNNMKAAGIMIYTIQVNTDGAAKSSVLASCASEPGDFFYLTSADQILDTFNTIGASLSQLRITN